MEPNHGRGSLFGVCVWLLLTLGVPALTPAPASAHASLSVASVSSAPPVAAWYDSLWTKIWNKINNSLNTRAGVIQWGLIGMLIALWIIWWRK